MTASAKAYLIAWRQYQLALEVHDYAAVDFWRTLMIRERDES